ncbi:MAG: sporulation protein [Bacteroidota bacterium]
MFGKVKKWLGIEGVKVELDFPEEVLEKDGAIPGVLRFQSLNKQTITKIKVVLIEKYSRGRKKDKLIDEYEINQIELTETIEVPPEEVVEVTFELPFQLVRSDIDQFEKKFLVGNIATLAKMINRVKSEYRVEAEAIVRGVALNPFDRKSIKIK